MNKNNWRDEYKLGPWRSVVGHRRLDAWRRLIDQVDDSHVFGFMSLVMAVAMLILIFAIAEAW